MRQAIHILKKDIRLLRFDIVLALLVAVAFTFTASSEGESFRASPSAGQIASELLTYLLPLTWSILIARTIYNEPLPGDRQFWVTRPYSPNSLLLAKSLFILAFVVLPKLLSDVVIIRSYGFPVWPELGGLLWSQLLLVAVFVLPIAAISTLTTGFVQLISVLSTAALVVVLWTLVVPRFSMDAAWLGLDWIRYYSSGIVAASAALGIIVLQYRRRNSKAPRYLVAGGIIMAVLPLAWLPWSAAFAIQVRLSAQPVDGLSVRVELDEERKGAVRAISREGGVELRVPIRITGLTSKFRPQVDGIAAGIEGPGGRVWRASPYPPNQVRTDGMLTSLRIRVDETFYQQIKNLPVSIRGSLYLTLHANERSAFVPLEGGSSLHATPGMCLCSLTQTGRGCLLSCRSAFRSRMNLVALDIVSGGPRMMPFLTLSYSKEVPTSYSPFPADLSLIPVTLTTRHTESLGDIKGVMVRAIEPVAHLRKEFEISGLRFGS